MVYSELFLFTKNGGKISISPICDPSDLPDPCWRNTFCSPTPGTVRCLNESVVFQSAYPCWKQGSRMQCVFSFLQGLCSWALRLLRQEQQFCEWGAAADGTGAAEPVSEATALGSSCDWEELKSFFYQKVWSQWSHFRDMLQQKDMTSCELQCINSSLTYCQVWGQRAKSHPYN